MSYTYAVLKSLTQEATRIQTTIVNCGLKESL